MLPWHNLEAVPPSFIFLKAFFFSQCLRDIILTIHIQCCLTLLQLQTGHFHGIGSLFFNVITTTNSNNNDLFIFSLEYINTAKSVSQEKGSLNIWCTKVLTITKDEPMTHQYNPPTLPWTSIPTFNGVSLIVTKMNYIFFPKYCETRVIKNQANNDQFML